MKPSEITDKLNDIYNNTTITSDFKSKVTDALLKIGKELGKIEEVNSGVNVAAYKRALTCASPELTVKDYANIVRETIILPVGGNMLYSGKAYVQEKMEDVVHTVLHSYKNLFAGKNEAIQQGDVLINFSKKKKQFA